MNDLNPVDVNSFNSIAGLKLNITLHVTPMLWSLPIQVRIPMSLVPFIDWLMRLR
jgi:hypothetical protein